MDDPRDSHGDNRDTLMARIDERLQATQKELHEVRTLLKEYVTKVEFWPVKMIALGLAALSLSTVLAAIVAKVIR